MIDFKGTAKIIAQMFWSNLGVTQAQSLQSTIEAALRSTYSDGVEAGTAAEWERGQQRIKEAVADERERCTAMRMEPTDILTWLRARGWSVAVHNDYRLNGEHHTFWLFTKDGRAVKGEGRTDTDALNQVRAAIREGQP